MEPQSLGILGGSFDPVHCGHLAVAQAALEHLGLDKVLFIPAGTPPHKARTVAVGAVHRCAMLKAAIQGNRQFEYSPMELQRAGKSFTVDTLARLKKRYPRTAMYFIIGSDNLTEMVTWRRYRDILRMITIAVTHRPGYAMRIPQQLTPAAIVRFPSPEWALSSSLVRTYLHNGQSCKYLLMPKTLAYIHAHGLYR